MECETHVRKFYDQVKEAATEQISEEKETELRLAFNLDEWDVMI